MKFFKLNFFQSGKGLCGGDFQNKEESVDIRLDHISSISGKKSFILPLSGVFVGVYFSVRMSNGDTYFIKEESKKKLYAAMGS
jgi:hypothetical protein